MGVLAAGGRPAVAAAATARPHRQVRRPGSGVETVVFGGVEAVERGGSPDNPFVWPPSTAGTAGFGGGKWRVQQRRWRAVEGPPWARPQCFVRSAQRAPRSASPISAIDAGSLTAGGFGGSASGDPGSVGASGGGRWRPALFSWDGNTTFTVSSAAQPRPSAGFHSGKAPPSSRSPRRAGHTHPLGGERLLRWYHDQRRNTCRRGKQRHQQRHIRRR